MTEDESRMLSYCQNAIRSLETQHDKDVRHLEKRIDDLEKLMNSKFEAQREAVETAHQSMLARFEGVNEFREALEALVRTYATRGEVNSTTSDLGRRLNNVESKMAGYDGRILGYSAGSAAVVLIIAIVMQLLNLGG